MNYIPEDKLRVNADWVWTRRCTNTDMILDSDGTKRYKVGEIYVADTYGDRSNWAIVKGVGPRCKDYTAKDIGAIVQLPEISGDHYRAPPIGRSADDPAVKDREDFFTRESVLVKLFPATVEL